MIRIAIVVGSTRPGRRADQVARWVHTAAGRRAAREGGVEYEVVDLAEAALPLLDEQVPAAIGRYDNEHTRRWARTVASFDGFVFVLPEYNHGMPAALKNAVDYLFAEWNDKAAGFVSYGLTGGVRAVEHARLVLAEVKVACVRSQVALSLFADFAIDDMAEPGTFTPAEHHLPILDRLLDELTAWAGAPRSLRTPRDGGRRTPGDGAAGDRAPGDRAAGDGAAGDGARTAEAAHR
jgi:NAD(P)H-dependent FMN reductase